MSRRGRRAEAFRTIPGIVARGHSFMRFRTHERVHDARENGESARSREDRPIGKPCPQGVTCTPHGRVRVCREHSWSRWRARATRAALAVDATSVYEGNTAVHGAIGGSGERAERLICRRIG